MRNKTLMVILILILIVFYIYLTDSSANEKRSATQNFDQIIAREERVKKNEVNIDESETPPKGPGYLIIGNRVPPTFKMPLITGCGRTGTHSISESLIASGFDFPHEHTLGKLGVVSWVHAYNDSNFAFEYGRGTGKIRKGILLTPIIHVIRHPLDVIRSINSCFCADGNITYYELYDQMSWDYLCRHIDCPAGGNRLQGAAHYWYYWNLHIESLGPQLRVPIEIFDNYSEEMFQLFREYYPEEASYRNRTMIDAFKVSNNGGKSPEYKTKLTWKELEEVDSEIAQKIKRLAKRYGYPVD